VVHRATDTLTVEKEAKCQLGTLLPLTLDDNVVPLGGVINDPRFWPGTQAGETKAKHRPLVPLVIANKSGFTL
jgi:hypothetical protein